MRAIALTALLLMAASAADAQFSPALQQKLQRLQSKPAGSWTKADFDEMAATILAMSREMLLSATTPAQRKRVEAVPVRATETEIGPPAWTDEHGVYVAENALGDLIFLGMYLGHDLYVVDGRDFPVQPSFVLHPYGVRPLLPLMPSVAGIASTIPQQLIRCPSNVPLCAEPQGFVTIAGTVGFVVAHEFGHRLLGHEQKTIHPLNEEIAADREAWRMLMALAPEASDNNPPLEAHVRTGVIAAPFLVLRWLHDTSGHDTEAADSRAEKLKELAGDEYFGDASSIVEPESVRVSLQNVRIAWSEEPDEITIEGVRVTPGEISGKTLRVLAPARIFARKAGRFAFAEVVRDGGVKSVTLDLIAPVANDSTRDELEQMRREQQWFRLFLATTTTSGAPRSDAAASYFNLASRRLFGDANDAQALSTWRPWR